MQSLQRSRLGAFLRAGRIFPVAKRGFRAGSSGGIITPTRRRLEPTETDLPTVQPGKTNMTDRTTPLAVFPGTFDPLTNGHLDVITRAADLYDELLVAVGDNPEKVPLLDLNKRSQMVRQAVADLRNVRVEAYSGLTVDYLRTLGRAFILRGIRNASDLASELQMAQTNRAVGGVETVFMLTSPEHAYISSGLVRQIARGGGDVGAMVPPHVLPYLKAT